MRRFGLRGALWAAPLALLIPAALMGCSGGSSGGVAQNASNSRAALNVYVTDGFSEKYKQVLVTLYKIEITTDGTNYQTVFSDDAGRTLDLATLSSAAELIASLNVATGTYTNARITFGDHVTLVTPDGTSTSTAVDSSVGTQANGQVTLTITTPTKVLAKQTNALVIDFKLAEFQLTGGVLRPHLIGGDASLCAGKQNRGHLRGTLANLSTTSFDLTGENGRTLSVVLTDATTITSGQTGAAVTLTSGQIVLVDGTFDPTTQKLTVTSVTLFDYTTFAHEQVSGTIASLNADAKSFVLTVTDADGIQPTGGTITVATDANTRFGKGRKQSGSFSDLTVNATIRAEGTFDAATQTLTARGVSGK